ncbi:hypothetical protein [Nonomuraea sp. CA-141351]|uniref:hypothetical protein n=1 Tax=Nonomuraea sp. CA-141351 TaxID=3239996 RepID=UPI003D8A702A
MLFGDAGEREIEPFASGLDQMWVTNAFWWSQPSRRLFVDYVIAMIAACAAFAGGVAFVVTRRDLGGGGRTVVPLACALLVGATCLFVPFLPVFAFLGTVVAYLIVRRLFSARLALAASGVLLLGGCSFSVLLMMAALESM